jgi:hypothetical protein
MKTTFNFSHLAFPLPVDVVQNSSLSTSRISVSNSPDFIQAVYKKLASEAILMNENAKVLKMSEGIMSMAIVLVCLFVAVTMVVIFCFGFVFSSK